MSGRPLIQFNPKGLNYIAFVVVVAVLVDIMVSFDIVSFAIMPPLSAIAPSTAVMLSDIVSMPSVAFRSVTIVFSVVVSVFGPQAETISAAPAIIEPVSTLEMSARVLEAP